MNTTGRTYVRKDGPKRLRRTRRDHREGGFSQWPKVRNIAKTCKATPYIRAHRAPTIEEF
jgi:hypothetical protein